MAPTSSGSLTLRSAVGDAANLSSGPRISYRPTPSWQVEVAAELRVKNPVRIRGWAEDYPVRVAAMLRAMNRCGARDQAERWMADFEVAFLSVPESWTGAYRTHVASDAAEDIRRSELAIDRTRECEDLYLLALRRQAADTLRAIRALEAKRLARQ